MEAPSTKAWLYVRGTESVRVVLEAASLLVYGPGPRFSCSRFPDATGAMLHHAQLQRELLADGFTQESTVTDRRSGGDRRSQSRGSDRRQILRLVSDRDKPTRS